MNSLLSVEPALTAAGFVGFWNTNVTAGRSRLDEGAAALLAGNPSLAGEHLPMEVALGRIHTDDKGWVFERIRRVRQTGGSFSAEFRVVTETGIRWVLNRGTLVPDDSGRMQGQGAYIDTTDAHSDVFMPAASLNHVVEDPLIAAADRCLEMHSTLKRGDYPDLRRLTEMLLVGFGRSLALRRS
ncbi:PAS domain-containing protein [Methylobacterium mesophilicum]